MPKTRVRPVLLTAVLGVMDEKVGILAPGRQVLQLSILIVGKHRDLVVGRKGETRGALVDSVTKRWNRVHQQMRGDAKAAYLESLARVPLDELHLRRHVVEAHRKVRGIHLVCERGLQRLRGTGRADDREVGTRHERRREKRKTLDVIEVGMRDQEMRLQRLRLLEAATQLGDA